MLGGLINFGLINFVQPLLAVMSRIKTVARVKQLNRKLRPKKPLVSRLLP
jgi:hypothetical protein